MHGMIRAIKKSYLKPWDILIIVVLTFASFLPVIIFGYQQSQAVNTEKEAVLRVDGQEIKTFALTTSTKAYTYTYEDEDGDYNIIEVDGNRIRIREASCGDQICVQRGWVQKNGETIVCLPHKLVIEVRSVNGGESDSLIY